MGILLQIIGVLCAVAAIVTGILSIRGRMPNYICLLLLFAAMFLIRLGRKLMR